MAKIAVISNKNSKKNMFNPGLLDEIDRLLGDRALHIATGAVEEVPAAVKRLREEEYDIVAVNSGDGGLNYVADEFIRQNGGAEIPLLVPMNGGTANVLSKSLRLRAKPLDILKKLMEHADKPREQIPTVVRNGIRLTFPKDGGKPEMNGFMLSTGIVYNFFDVFDNSPVKGFQAYVSIIWRVFIGQFTKNETYRKIIKRMDLMLKFDDEAPRRTSVLSTLAACENFSIFGLKPFSPTGPGRFNFILATCHHMVALMLMMVSMINIKPGGPGIRNGILKSILIEPAEGEKENNFNLDGENFPWSSSYRIEPGRQFLFVDLMGVNRSK